MELLCASIAIAIPMCLEPGDIAYTLYSPNVSSMCSIGNLEMFYPMNFFGDLYSHGVLEQIQLCCPSGNLGQFFLFA